MEQEARFDKPPTEAYEATLEAVTRAVSKGVRPDGSLSPDLIRGLLRLNRVDMCSIARQWGAGDAVIHRAVNYTDKNPKKRQLIADALGMPYPCVWGTDGE